LGDGTKGAEKASPVINGWQEACSAVHLSLGSSFNSPKRKSVKATRVRFSEEEKLGGGKGT